MHLLTKYYDYYQFFIPQKEEIWGSTWFY